MKSFDEYEYKSAVQWGRFFDQTVRSGVRFLPIVYLTTLSVATATVLSVDDTIINE
jgi:hypothetical protein